MTPKIPYVWVKAYTVGDPDPFGTVHTKQQLIALAKKYGVNWEYRDEEQALYSRVEITLEDVKDDDIDLWYEGTEV